MPFKGYAEACVGIRSRNWKYGWFEVEKAPFVYETSAKFNDPYLLWAGFENTKSIDLKFKYLMKAGLGGATLFSIEKDDPDRLCFQGTFPLIRVINHNLNKKLKVAFPDSGIVFGSLEEGKVPTDRAFFGPSFNPAFVR